MVAEGYRARFAASIQRVAAPFERWSPAALSALALACAVGAGAVALSARWLGPYPFLAVCLLIFASGLFDVIDGEVARRTGRASARGDFLDHVFDRYADMAILLGLAFSAWANAVVALLALVSLLLVSYMGTQAQAVGAGRMYRGLLSRADRLLILTLATFLEFDLSLPWPWAPTAPWSRLHVAGLTFTVIDVALVYFVLAGQLTAAMRAWSVHRQLAPPPPAAP